MSIQQPFQPINLQATNEDQLASEFNYIIDEDNITEARKKGDIISKGWTNEDFYTLRKLCKNELFYLTESVLGYNRLSTNLHGHLCEWIDKTKHLQFREILLPRGHFKSTVLTIAHSIQIVLPDDSNSLPWPLNLGTNCRLLIAHETDSQASKFLFAITQHFLSNPLLMALFPECIPNPRKHKINKNELELPRTERWPEPTIDTMGVGGKSQGRHYNYLKLDDLFGDKARDSQAERETTIQWFDNIQSFFSFFKKDKLDLIGTRWSLDDLYAHAHRVYGDLLVRYIRPIEELKRQSDGSIKKELIFPEEFTPEILTVIKKNKKIYNAQYLNNPKEGANKFLPEWKQYFTWIDRRTIVFKDRRTGEDRVRNLSDLDIVILVDPADTGDYGYCITGMDLQKNKFILKAIQRPFSPSQFVDEIFKDVMLFQPRVAGIEEVLFSTLYQVWLKAEQKLRGIRFKVEPLKVKKRAQDKELRVEALEPYFSAGEMFFHESQEDLLEQYDNFGSITQYHVLDALAHGPQIWRTPTPDWVKAGIGNDTKEDDRDEETGYSML